MSNYNLQKKIHMSRLPPVLPGKNNPNKSNEKRIQRGPKDFTPVTWDQYFEKSIDLQVDNDIFRIYERGNSGPVCFFLHGGGFSGLSWAVLSKLLSELVTCRCVAMDLRGHGDTNTTDDSDLSADVLASDVGRVVEKLYGDNPPPIVLIGHSMGGAIAVHTVYKKTLPSICGLIVIDVVEGTAMEALSSMQSFLRSRPATFKSVESAIEYCCKSGQIRNMESAKVSVIGQLKRIDTNETATHEITHEHQDQTQIPVNSSRAHEAISEAISEADEEDDESAEPEPKKPSSGPPAATSNKDVEFKHPHLSVGGNQYAWRIDLTKTEVYWKGWFEGLSNMFLSCGTAKMLLCAGIDRLDKDMTVGQMQGKFQLELLPQCGHAVHEDCPEKVSDVLATFLIRNRLVEHSGIERRGIPF